MTEEYRKIKILLDGVWTGISYRHLTKGSMFRMFERDGEPVADINGRTDFLAVSDSYEKDGLWTIEVEALIK